MKKYLVALDQGTTSSRAIVFDRSQQIVASAQKEFPQLYPQAGWVEHDPLELYSSQYGVMMEAITRGGIDPAEIAAIGITNQRETTIVWEKATGRPIYPAIVWQCRRTAALCDRLRADGLTEHIRAVTGLVPDAYFSATKIRWILDHVPGAQERAERGELLFGTVDSWLVWKLTRGRVHATDVTNASRTMLFDIRRLDWDETLLQVLRIPRCMLPDVRPSSGDFGTCNIQGVEIPIAGAAGDQQAALFGQCCFAPGEAKNTYGTGCFLLMNTGETPCVSRHGLVTTIAAGLGGHVTYALEGSVFVGGAVIQWLRDEMRFLSEASDAEYYAQKVDSTGGVYFVPAFTGRRRAVLGYVRPRGHRRHHARHEARAHHPRCAGIHRLPEHGPRRRHGEGHRRAAARAARRRRGEPRCLPHAVPGGHAGHAGAPPRHPRDDGPRRGVSGRARRRHLARSGRAAPPVAVRCQLPAAYDGRAARKKSPRLGKGRRQEPRLGERRVSGK